MICIYSATANKNTVLNTNGDAVLDDICTKAEVTEGLNGEYALSAVFQFDNENLKHEYLNEECIIKCPDVHGDEVFRINEITLRSNGKEIEVYARHILYDSLTLFIEAATITDANGSGYLSTLFSSTTTPHEFTYSSNITATESSTFTNLSLYDAIYSDDYCLLNMIGGEVTMRQYQLNINASTGVNNGVKIHSRKNLKGFEMHTNIDNIITRIYPEGASGLTIPEKYVDSPYISYYTKIRSKKICYQEIGVDETNGITEAIAQQQLRDAINKNYTVDKVDIVQAEYSIDFVALNKTEEYKNIAILETIAIGDMVSVYEENFKLNVNVRVTERIYNCINGVLASISLSNIAKRTKPNMRKVVDKLNNILDPANPYSPYNPSNPANPYSPYNPSNPYSPVYPANLKPKIYVGTTEPAGSLGENGDVYIKYTV